MKSFFQDEFVTHYLNNNLNGVIDCLSRGVNVEAVTEALMFSCQFGHSAMVSRLVQVPGLNINIQNEDGLTSAHLATLHCHTECVKILSNTQKVNWNKRDMNGGTPLYLALEKGHFDIVGIIVQEPNINFNVRNEDGETLAQTAVWNGDVKCVEILAAQESFDCWNVPDSEGDTPIMWALKWRKSAIVEILLRCPRVDLNYRDEEGWSLIFRAIQNRQLGKKMLK